MGDVRYVTLESTSRDSAVGDPIVLRRKTATQLVFLPTVVNNPANPRASIRGTFVYQRKNHGGEWQDFEHLDLTRLKAGEWVKLELKSQEVLDLLDGVIPLYKLHEEFGVPYGRKEFVLAEKDSVGLIEAIVRDEDALQEVLRRTDLSAVLECIRKLARLGNLQEVSERLGTLDIDSLEQLSAAAGIATLRKVQAIWEENEDNPDEEFWQQTLHDYSWVISQIFASPVVILGQKVYVGGKSLENQGGKVADFIYQKTLTGNVVLIEIKTPQTTLVGHKYRNGVYSIDQSLTGTINQVLFYKDEFLKNFFSLWARDGRTDSVVNPKCVVIAGSLQNDLSNAEKMASFEAFRRELRDVELITFDELFNKVGVLLKLLMSGDTK